MLRQRHGPARQACHFDPAHIVLCVRWYLAYKLSLRNLCGSIAGQTIDCLLSERRDIWAVTRFFQQAIEKQGVPEKMTLDEDAASHQAVAELKQDEELPETVTGRTMFKSCDRSEALRRTLPATQEPSQSQQKTQTRGRHLARGKVVVIG